MIQVQNLCKNYGHRKAIEDLNFHVKKGEVVGLLGPNGAGKTTTMRIITGFMVPSSGEVILGGDNIFENPIQAKKKIGYLPEIPPLYQDMTVTNYLKFVAQLKQVPHSQIKKNVEQAIESTNLQQVSSRQIQNLSKGFRGRVGLAQALVSLPEILILDEPTVGLDPRQVAEVRKLIGNLKGDHTILLSTHILSEVQANCDRVIIVNEGRIVAEDSLEALAQSSRLERKIQIEVRHSSVESINQLKNLDFVTSLEEQNNKLIVGVNLSGNELERLSKAIVELNFGLLSMQPLHLELEDAFIRLTQSKET